MNAGDTTIIHQPKAATRGSQDQDEETNKDGNTESHGGGPYSIWVWQYLWRHGTKETGKGEDDKIKTERFKGNQIGFIGRNKESLSGNKISSIA